MSETSKPQEPVVAAEATQPTVVASEVDKSIPEPVVGQPSAPEQPPAAAATEELKAEKAKEADKSDDTPRGLLKEFQNKIAGVFPKKAEKSTEVKETKKEETTDDKEESEEKRVRDVKESKDTKERRSGSRKRNSIFGGFGLGKREDKPAFEEPPTEEPVKEAPPIETVAPCPEQSTPNPEAPAPEAPAERPVPTKRTSIFDSFRSQFSKKDKVESPTATSHKESEITTTSLPVIPAVGYNEADKDVSTTDVVKEAVQEAQTTVENKVEKLAAKAEKRKSSLPFGLGLGKKEKNVSSDDEVVEKPRSPFAKLRATVKSKTSPKLFHDKKEEQSTSANATAPAAAAAAAPAAAVGTKEEVAGTPQTIVTSPEPATQSQATEVAASA